MEVEVKEMRREGGDDLYEWPGSTCAGIHSLLKLLRLEAWCVDTLFQKYIIAKDAQLRSLKRAFGNNIQQTFVRLPYMCSCSKVPQTPPTNYDGISVSSCAFCCNTDDLQPMQVSSL